LFHLEEWNPAVKPKKKNMAGTGNGGEGPPRRGGGGEKEGRPFLGLGTMEAFFRKKRSPFLSSKGRRGKGESEGFEKTHPITKKTEGPFQRFKRGGGEGRKRTCVLDGQKRCKHQSANPRRKRPGGALWAWSSESGGEPKSKRSTKKRGRAGIKLPLASEKKKKKAIPPRINRGGSTKKKKRKTWTPSQKKEKVDWVLLCVAKGKKKPTRINKRPKGLSDHDRVTEYQASEKKK